MKKNIIVIITLSLLLFTLTALAADTAVQIISSTDASDDTLAVGTTIEVPDLLTLTVTGTVKVDELYGQISGVKNDLLIIETLVENNGIDTILLKDNISANISYNEKYTFDCRLYPLLSEYLLSQWNYGNDKDFVLYINKVDENGVTASTYLRKNERFEYNAECSFFGWRESCIIA
jgi:hypothetical protein